jgi:His/Glu/Gln/Arg/opine family amino acid ABC transporter permease subunit
MNLIEIAWELLPYGIVNIVVTVVSFPLALAVAVLVAAVRIARIPVLSQLCAIYVDAVRMTPLVLHLFFFFFALPLVGIVFSANASVIIAMALHIGAYQSEVVRAAFLSIPRGLFEASEVLGITSYTRLRRVTVPLALRVAIPPLANTLLEMFRATSVVALVTIHDIVFKGFSLSRIIHQPTEVFLVIGAYFAIIGIPATWLIKRLERRVALP